MHTYSLCALAIGTLWCLYLVKLPQNVAVASCRTKKTLIGRMGLRPGKRSLVGRYGLRPGKRSAYTPSRPLRFENPDWNADPLPQLQFCTEENREVAETILRQLYQLLDHYTTFLENCFNDN